MGINLDDDMAYYDDEPAEPMDSPSDLLSAEPEVPVGTNSPPEEGQSLAADLHVATTPSSWSGQTPRDLRITSEHFELTHTVALRNALPNNVVQTRIDYERHRFESALQKCHYLRGQDEESLRRIWRKREAAIVMDLVVVPLPEPQPIFGQTYSRGSHRNIKDAYGNHGFDF